MRTLEKRTPRVESDLLRLPVHVALIELGPDDSAATQPPGPQWEERFWNLLAQAHQSEEELWSFLGNWDL